MLGLLRRAIGIPKLEASIRESHRSLASLLEEKKAKSFAQSMPLILSGEVSQDDLLHLCGLMAPAGVEGFRKIRLGNAHDGGYIFLDDFQEISQVISCGISNDVTCDLAFAELGKPVVQFDHTVDGPPVPHPKFQFRKQAIDALGTIPGSVRLWDVVSEVGDPARTDLLLKIDIDGDEWTTFAGFPVDSLKRFRQISCEFHWSSKLADPEHFALCLRAVENIRKSFFPVHVHANNFVGFANVMGVPIPEVFEVTFVNASIYRAGKAQKEPRSELDSPNNPDAPDLYLGSPFRVG
ncbi:hypothetical protein [Pseudorhodoplanes sp.]|uniref:hypothetical protein n=1 Tax=Pseudorhodoplanes sp. TaxID=1934341 RepID=UPI003D0D4902